MNRNNNYTEHNINKRLLSKHDILNSALRTHTSRPDFHGKSKLSSPGFRPRQEEPLYLLNPQKVAELESTYENLIFSMKLPNIPAQEFLKVVVHRLTNSNVQDVLNWTSQLRDLAKANEWEDNTSQRILELLLKPDFKEFTKDKRTFNTKLDAIWEKVFPITKYHTFKNFLHNTKRNRFTSL